MPAVIDPSPARRASVAAQRVSVAAQRVSVAAQRVSVELWRTVVLPLYGSDPERGDLAP